eukprot:scaffold230504_cov24-Prasinocladus_malaysianus.AAC.1
MSQPPPDFPIPDLEAAPSQVRPLLRKVQALEREKAELGKQVINTVIPMQHHKHASFDEQTSLQSCCSLD